MAKVWVLDTDTKGTGAQMVPLETVQHQPTAEHERIFADLTTEPPQPAGPKARPSFKVVDAMTRRVLAEDADTRTTIDVLEGVRRLVDVSLYVRQRETDSWRRLSHGEEKLLWGFRGR